MKILDNSIIVDTNMWIYFLNKDSIYHQKAKEGISQLINLGYNLFITSQIVREILVVLTKEGIMEKAIKVDEAISKINELLEFLSILYENEKSLYVLKDLVKKYQLKGKRIHDVNVVAVAVVNNIRRIFTHNIGDFKCFSEITPLSFSMQKG